MFRRPAVASRVARAIAPYVALVVLAWSGCALNRSGLSSGTGQGGGAGSSPLAGAGGHARGGSGGTPSVAGFGGATTGVGGVASAANGGSAGAAGGVMGEGAGGDGGGAGTTGVGGLDGTAGLGGASGGAGTSDGAGGVAGGGGAGGLGGGAGSGGSGGGWTGFGGFEWGSRGGASGGLPMCDPSMKDNDPCTRGEAACRKTCGVSGLATKACTCSFAGQWDCGTCTYPAGDYSCYQLPAFVPSCPFGTMSGDRCSTTCSVCSGYADSTGMSKAGYCSCSDPDAYGVRVYHCASSSEWPPQ
jgi:hypothetical protein